MTPKPCWLNCGVPGSGLLRSETARATGFLALLLLMLALPAAVPGQDYTYTTNNGTITLIAYTGSGGAVTIPSMITSLPVTSIGSNAFGSCSMLTNVTVPSGVTVIGDSTFAGCSSLTSVTILGKINGIGNGRRIFFR